jgi:uncharacterized protein YfiM (DUF2279 family)
MTPIDLAIGFALGYVVATLTLSGIQYGVNKLLDSRREAKELEEFNKAIEKLKEYSDSRREEEAKKPAPRRKKTGDA